MSDEAGVKYCVVHIRNNMVDGTGQKGAARRSTQPTSVFTDDVDLVRDICTWKDCCVV